MIIVGILYLLIFLSLIFRFSLNTSEQYDVKLLTHKILCVGRLRNNYVKTL